MIEGGSGHTIGVTVAVPSPHREVIDTARERFEPSSTDMSAHITILAPIDVDGEALPAVLTHLQWVAAQTRPFRLRLRGTGTFRPVSPVVFLAVAEGISACEELERAVRSGVLGVESRFPYHPHVTIAHDVGDRVLDRAFDEMADFTAAMDVSGMELHEIHHGHWTLLRRFDFTG